MTRNSTVSPEEVASDKQERDERWKKLQTERAARLVTHDFGANPQFADREAPMKKINIALGEIATAAHISAARAQLDRTVLQLDQAMSACRDPI